jgi:hypothetical protein
MRAPQSHIHAFRKQHNKSMLLQQESRRKRLVLLGGLSKPQPPQQSTPTLIRHQGHSLLHPCQGANMQYTVFLHGIPTRNPYQRGSPHGTPLTLHTGALVDPATTTRVNNQPRPLVLGNKVAHMPLLLPRYSHIYHHEDTSRVSKIVLRS